MKLCIIENRQITFKQLIMSYQGISEALGDIANNRITKTKGPITINHDYWLLDGYHRVVEAILKGKKSLPFQMENYYDTPDRKFKITNEPLQGLEELIEQMDDNDWQNLSQYPLAKQFINQLINHIT